PTISDGIKTIKTEDFLAVHRIPCAREGFMTGIGSGAVVGGLRYVRGAQIPSVANYAVTAALVGMVVQWEFCQYQRIQERAAMARVVEVIDRKQAEKQQRAEEAALRRAERAAQEAAQKSWFRFW
ncbi:uncharacterized protein BCR38DRAFT_320380, partial [Pseudomassariella vexata]